MKAEWKPTSTEAGGPCATLIGTCPMQRWRAGSLAIEVFFSPLVRFGYMCFHWMHTNVLGNEYIALILCVPYSRWAIQCGEYRTTPR